MIFEVAVLNLRPGLGPGFEAAFAAASPYIAAAPGYVSHTLQRCIEVPDRYLLLVQWRTLDHTEGFRRSDRYEHWRHLLHHFDDPFPTVEHLQPVANNP